jgi:hypothetical protein
MLIDMRDYLKTVFGGQNLMAMVFSLGFIGLGVWMVFDATEEGGGLMLVAGCVGLLFVLITSYVTYKRSGK